ncbi:uncharacterized protein LOC129913616 [Episyrphus balteatus]|uniref:uncharacterized protein LOC129913616 n=1 Tax=Episyrphus balteatus TaxID=286459 RepID=UPI0024857D98|nr:uncharacterized protein LOC129913616 [Episyrphus balteatus]
MKKIIFVLLLSLAFATCSVINSQEDQDEVVSIEDNSPFDEDDETYIDLLRLEEDDQNGQEVNPNRGLIISSIVKKSLKNMIKQMPCGWPEAGVPSLAPYRREEINLQAKKSFLSTVSQLVRFRLDGLDDIKIKKLSMSYMYKKVKFHFIFRKIKATSKFNTDTLIDLLNELGIKVRYEGKGAIDFGLMNLSIKGSFKYKAPMIWGSVKIYKFKIAITLGGCKSNITGIAPTSNTNRLINNLIEDTILSGINDNQAEISSRIEDVVVPSINESLKGKNIWGVIAMKPPKPDGKCVAPPDPWA